MQTKKWTDLKTEPYRTQQKDPRTIPHRKDHIIEENEDYVTEEITCIQIHIELRRKTHEQYHTGQIHIEHGMGWLRLVGSLKVQVSFAEYHLFYRALLQKRPIILRSLIVATP